MFTISMYELNKQLQQSHGSLMSLLMARNIRVIPSEVSCKIEMIDAHDKIILSIEIPKEVQ